ncbi:hypothetical protein HanRHA438_Chr12g0559171 [Helianthus annuus]|nr:hypothetical protein HanRHA438_Chr12g0559171 [Helianthus annuus]
MCMPIRVVRVKKLGSSTPPSKNNLSCWGTRPKETTIRVMYAPPPPPRYSTDLSCLWNAVANHWARQRWRAHISPPYKAVQIKEIPLSAPLTTLLAWCCWD